MPEAQSLWTARLNIIAKHSDLAGRELVETLIRNLLGFDAELQSKQCAVTVEIVELERAEDDHGDS